MPIVGARVNKRTQGAGGIKSKYITTKESEALEKCVDEIVASVTQLTQNIVQNRTNSIETSVKDFSVDHQNFIGVEISYH